MSRRWPRHIAAERAAGNVASQAAEKAALNSAPQCAHNATATLQDRLAVCIEHSLCAGVIGAVQRAKRTAAGYTSKAAVELTAQAADALRHRVVNEASHLGAKVKGASFGLLSLSVVARDGGRSPPTAVSRIPLLLYFLGRPTIFDVFVIMRIEQRGICTSK